MKCSNCAGEVPSQSRFCLRCGAPISTAQGGVTPFVNPTGSFATALPAKAPVNTKMIAATVVLILACLGLLAWTVSGQLLQKTGKSGASSMVQAPDASHPGTMVQAPAASSPAAMVQAPTASNPTAMVQAPTTTAPASPPVQAPAAAAPDHSDVEDYLRFVREIELTKQGLISKELADAIKSYGGQLRDQTEAATNDEESKKYLPKVNEDSGKASEDWNNLTKQFLSRQPPQDCVELHDKYWDHMGKVQGMFTKLHGAIADASQDTNKAIDTLTGMLGASSSEADRSAALADDALADVCKRDNLSKDFSIRTDSSSSASMIR